MNRRMDRRRHLQYPFLVVGVGGVGWGGEGIMHWVLGVALTRAPGDWGWADSRLLSKCFILLTLLCSTDNFISR